MKIPRSLIVLGMLAVVAFADESAAPAEKLPYPEKVYLTAAQLYAENDMNKHIGQFVVLDVVVKFEQKDPLVDIVRPKDPAGRALGERSAQLFGVSSEAWTLQKNARRRIAGIIVKQDFGAYTIYVHRTYEATP